MDFEQAEKARAARHGSPADDPEMKLFMRGLEWILYKRSMTGCPP
jgi:hypothetical protein